jgi:hypothetical protein
MRTILLLAVMPVLAARAQDRSWSIGAEPVLRLGDATSDKAVLFGAGLVGATRLPNGNILVADRGEFSLKVFDTTGKLVKSLGRKGSGPGEMTFVAKLWRCGDEIIAYDIENGYRNTVFSPDLKLKRSFRFHSPTEGGGVPYASSCNAAGRFVHHGWESHKAMKAGVFRTPVPIWTSGADSTGKVVGEMLGSERWGQVVDGQFRGTRPLPLGKEPVIAMGDDRFYTGTADTYTITMHAMDGRVLGTFGKPAGQLATTRADIDLAIEMEAAGRGDDVRARVRAAYEKMDLPRTVPAYRAMRVDAVGDVWVQDYPRSKSSMATWTVFTREGRQLTEVRLPTALTVFEIGKDYVLGRYVDPEEDIPEIRMYRLRR